MQRFYKPAGARLGDVIPYFADGVFHIFYLMRFADDTHDRPETYWGHLTTTDFVTITDHGIAIDQGPEASDDPSVATGSVIRVDDEYHAYYTGFSDWNLHNGGRNQTVLRARSTDLITWTKDQDFRLVADESRYQRHEWRDPFVFADPDGAGLRMLVSAQLRDGLPLRRGALAELSSTDDGTTWHHEEHPFWAPGLYVMHECADVFKMGDYWYLIYSTLNDRTVTRYRIARDLRGPWWSPADDELDGVGLYAAKTVSDGDRRYLVGWCANREAGRDDGAWLWGGNLVVHELRAADDGPLLVSIPDVVREARAEQAVSTIVLDPAHPANSTGYAGRTITEMPQAGVVDLTLTPDAGTKRFGIEVHATADRTRGYSIIFGPSLGRIIVDRLARFGAERPLDIRPYAPGTQIRLTVEFDGEIVLVYVDERLAITVRGYDTYGADFGVFAVEGGVAVEEGTLTVVRERKPR